MRRMTETLEPRTLLSTYVINGGAGGRRLAARGAFSQADFNYDGNVNLQDFNILAGRFGNELGPALVTAPARVADTARLRDALDDLRA